MIVETNISVEDMMNKANSCYSVIEVGCGECNYLSQVKAPVRIGIEGFRPLIEKYKDHENYTNIIPMCLDIMTIDSVFVNKSIDAIIGIDIIEHFTMEDAITVLSKFEAIAKRYCMFMIPMGNHPQEWDDRGFGNEMNYHRSTWYPEDAEKLGYDVYFDRNYYNPIILQHGKELGCMYCIKEL